MNNSVNGVEKIITSGVDFSSSSIQRMPSSGDESNEIDKLPFSGEEDTNIMELPYKADNEENGVNKFPWLNDDGKPDLDLLISNMDEITAFLEAQEENEQTEGVDSEFYNYMEQLIKEFKPQIEEKAMEHQNLSEL